MKTPILVTHTLKGKDENDRNFDRCLLCYIYKEQMEDKKAYAEAQKKLNFISVMQHVNQITKISRHV